MPLRLRVGGAELALLSTVATFGTPLDVTVAELVVETFFPADEATGRWLRDRASTRRRSTLVGTSRVRRWCGS